MPKTGMPVSRQGRPSCEPSGGCERLAAFGLAALPVDNSAGEGDLAERRAQVVFQLQLRLRAVDLLRLVRGHLSKHVPLDELAARLKDDIKVLLPCSQTRSGFANTKQVGHKLVESRCQQ